MAATFVPKPGNSLFTSNKKLTNPGSPAAHQEPVYRCFLPDLTGFTDLGRAGPGLVSALEQFSVRGFTVQSN